MLENFNPFFLNAYHGPEYFCDREEENARLLSNVRNGINTTLLSIRRMGKTGLLHHTFHALEKSRKTKCIYVDIYATNNEQMKLRLEAYAKIATEYKDSYMLLKLPQLANQFKLTLDYSG